MTIDAVYIGGVLKPLAEVDLNLLATPLPLPTHVEEWMLQTKAHREALFEKYGFFSDSTEIVTADRRRDG